AYSIGGPMKGRVFTQVDIVESKKMDEGLVTIDEARLKSALEKEGKVVIYGIHFDFDSSRIKPESNPQLDEIAKALAADQKVYLVVGHTDNQGQLDYNQRLSEARANAVVEALVQRGIQRDRLIPVGVGMSVPVATNETEEGRAKNRRVELVRR
ncbi:MAG: OmpA family protein, partial [Deltaproteobacteria bacterium]|nr:OmpA family protein [Deltaproteobacteria bacterium]